MNWKSFSPCSWKYGTLKTIICLVCAAPYYLQEELDHIAYASEKLDDYPKSVLKQSLEEVKYNHPETSHEVSQINETNYDEKSHLFDITLFWYQRRKTN